MEILPRKLVTKLKDQFNPNLTQVLKKLGIFSQTLLAGVTVNGYEHDEKNNCFFALTPVPSENEPASEHVAEATNSTELFSPQTPVQSSLFNPSGPPIKSTSQPNKSTAVRNLNQLFQPSPPTKDLLHLNHPAVLLLPDEILGQLR